MCGGQDVSKGDRDDEEECPELKKLYCKRLVILTGELDPHTFSVLISDCLADIPTDVYLLPCYLTEVEKNGWAGTRLARGRAGQQQPRDPSVIGRRRKMKVKCLTAEPAGRMPRRKGLRTRKRLHHYPTQTIVEPSPCWWGPLPSHPHQSKYAFYLIFFSYGALLSALISEIFIPDRGPKLEPIW